MHALLVYCSRRRSSSASHYDNDIGLQAYNMPHKTQLLICGCCRTGIPTERRVVRMLMQVLHWMDGVWEVLQPTVTYRPIAKDIPSRVGPITDMNWG